MKLTRPIFLRRLLKPAIVLVLAAAPPAYVLWTRAKFEDQYRAVEEIEELGGTARLSPKSADAMCRFIRPEAYVDVSRLEFHSNKEITPEIMDRICRLRTLQYLDVSGSVVQSGQFGKLAALHDLSSLGLSGTNVSDDDLLPLSRLQSLGVLELDHTAITDKGLQHIARMNGLVQLLLGGTRVTDAGLPALGTLKGLKDLFFFGGGPAAGPGRAALQKSLPKLSID